MPAVKRVALHAYANRSTANLLFRIGSRLQLPLARGEPLVRGRSLPILKRQTSWRSLPALARRPLHGRVRERPPNGERSGRVVRTPLTPNAVAGKRVAIFPGCMTDWLYPEQGEAVVTVLDALGVEIISPKNLHCCGLIHQNSGDQPRARSMARQTIAALEQVDADYIVSGSASCVAVLAQDYQHQLRNDPMWLPRAQRLACKVLDFTSFLVNEAQLQPGSLASPAGSSRTVTYHDSCQGLNVLGLSAEPRELIEGVMGDTIAELPENTLCCGFGGTFSLDYPEVSKRLMDRKLDNAESTGARTIVTDNQGCIMQLRGGSDAEGRSLEVRHIAELLAERVEEHRKSRQLR